MMIDDNLAMTDASDQDNDRTPKQWLLRLYIAGQSAKSLAAMSNLHAICEERLAGHYEIEIIDLLKQPQLAEGDQIIAIPTLIRKLPSPIRKLIGDLSDSEKTLVGLQLKPKHD